MGLETVWNGIEYEQVTSEDAEAMEAADKCQRVEQRFISGTELKTREEFTGYRTANSTGYKTREMRARPNPEAKTEPPKKEKQEDKPAASFDEKDWLKHRKAAGEFYGKTTNKVTKAEVIEFMKRQE